MRKGHTQQHVNSATGADARGQITACGNVACARGFIGRSTLLLLFGSFLLSAQTKAPTDTNAAGQPIRVVVESKPPEATGPWLDFLRIIIPGVIGAGSAILAAFLANAHNRKRQAEDHRHQRELLEINLKNQEAKAVNEWFLAVYTTEAIEPLETALLWLNEIFAWSNEETIPNDLRQSCYTCLARIATVIDTYAFFRFFNTLVAATVVVLQTQRTSPEVYAALGLPIRQQITIGYVEASRFLNQLQEAMRFTIINHRSDVYKLAQSDRFRAFKERAETLSNSLDLAAIGKMLSEVERRRVDMKEKSGKQPDGQPSA